MVFRHKSPVPGILGALFLAPNEEEMLIGIMQQIDLECRSNVDHFSQSVIIAQIELLLTYADRYYHRQFITRKIVNYQVLDKLNVSPNYLSRLLKTLTGQSTQQHIHDKLIEKAREKLSTTELSVSEIAYELGFEHPQSFSKLFRIKTNASPLEFRQSFN